MRAMKKKFVVFGIIVVLVLYIIFLHWTINTRNTGITRLFTTTSVWAGNTDIEAYLYVLEMLDGNDVVAAKEHIQKLLYIRIVVPPMWEFTDSFGTFNLKDKRIELLKRIKQYHEDHKDEIDMDLPSNKLAVQQFDVIR